MHACRRRRGSGWKKRPRLPLIEAHPLLPVVERHEAIAIAVDGAHLWQTQRRQPIRGEPGGRVRRAEEAAGRRSQEAVGGGEGCKKARRARWTASFRTNRPGLGAAW
eukprot:5161235-Prymnesium_polylepis.1